MSVGIGKQRTKTVSVAQETEVLKLFLSELQSIGWYGSYRSRFGFTKAQLLLQNIFKIRYLQDDFNTWSEFRLFDLGNITRDTPRLFEPDNSKSIDNVVYLEDSINSVNEITLENVFNRIRNKQLVDNNLLDFVLDKVTNYINNWQNHVYLEAEQEFNEHYFQMHHKHDVARMWEAMTRIFLIGYLHEACGLSLQEAWRQSKFLSRYSIFGDERQFWKFLQERGIKELHGDKNNNRQKPHLSTALSFLCKNLNKGALTKGTVHFDTDYNIIDVTGLQECSFRTSEHNRARITQYVNNNNWGQYCRFLLQQREYPDNCPHKYLKTSILLAFPVNTHMLRVVTYEPFKDHIDFKI